MDNKISRRSIGLIVNYLVLALFLFISFTSKISAENRLKLNDKDYFETRGFNVLVFENEYNGMFFDEKTAGILLIHHGVRTATGGAVRLKPTPEQWDQIPRVVERNVNKEDNSIDVLLRYEDFDFNSRLYVQPRGDSLLFRVTLDKPLPKKLEGRTGLNIEFLPSKYFGKTYIMDDKMGIFPRYPFGPMKVLPAETQLRQFSDHTTFDDRGRGEYVEAQPIASGHKLILAPDDPESRIVIQALDGVLSLLDGRTVAQNGWFVVRSLIPANKTGIVVEWLLTPNLIPNWTKKPMIGYSQVGYHPDQQKKAIIELDVNDTSHTKVSLFKLDNKGEWQEVLNGEVEEWGNFLRYNYVTFDFSSVKENGLYMIQYGGQKSGSFRIGPHVYDDIWQPTLDVWFPVQMDHMFVNEAYRVWHGAAHLDDARQAPTNHQHFDGFRMDDSTDTQYKVGEHIPGLNIGGWFDAGDYDIRTSSHCPTVMHLVDAWEHFKIERDETLIDQKQRYVDIHHPDGHPDLLQQIEHGTLALIAQHRAFGRAIQDIIVPHLHQYHHLGDGSTMTDNLVYNPDLQPYETDGYTSGTPDDRWAFTNRSSFTNYSSMSALAAASRALRGYHDALADECLETAKKAWLYEHENPVSSGRFGAFGEMSAALQLYISTKEEMYAEKFEELLWPSMERGFAWSIGTAINALPYMDSAYKEKLRPYVEKYKASNEELLRQNPYGVSISRGGWAGNSGIIRWAITNYLLHKAYPDIIGPEYTFRGVDYIFGCHPTSNVSFVSGIGAHSKTMAYGNNRADFSFIAGGVVPGVLILKPDFPEHMTDWPFLWGENEYVIDICAAYIFLANAVQDLARE
ncbi:glycoside hydrolase [candidate division KSB1 bacterium]|nr:glycoside hydrolase family 9 protein [candidate division KSB1 bacterium]RQW05185.1 MAG: glycoside hydrolase [candidate division KSB1 bacterium]